MLTTCTETLMGWMLQYVRLEVFQHHNNNVSKQLIQRERMLFIFITCTLSMFMVSKKLELAKATFIREKKKDLHACSESMGLSTYFRGFDVELNFV